MGQLQFTSTREGLFPQLLRHLVGTSQAMGIIAAAIRVLVLDEKQCQLLLDEDQQLRYFEVDLGLPGKEATLALQMLTIQNLYWIP